MKAFYNLIILLLALIAVQNVALAMQVETLFDFNGTDGAIPQAGFIRDPKGNLYGTTLRGGANNAGTIYRLTPPAKGQTAWTLTLLHEFSITDGTFPAAGLLRDTHGNLYGTTMQGGANNSGTVFRLTPPSKGQTEWTQTTLLEFNGTNGAGPYGGLLPDTHSNLYGTTVNGGANGAGTVFRLAPIGRGKTEWTQTILLNFNGTNDGYPYGDLLRDIHGNLYGTTSGVGDSDVGTVFKLMPPAKGKTAWTQTTLLAFNGSNGANPQAGLIRDPKGNLYGTTLWGGANNVGTVFKLMPPVRGQAAWIQSTLLEFNSTDGSNPYGRLLRDAKGNLYGTTTGGGANSHGSVFRLTPPARGQTGWTQTTLLDFNGTDGAIPNGTLLRDALGNLYGAASGGGANNAGTVFRLTP